MTYEINFTKKYVSRDAWEQLFKVINKLIGLCGHYRIVVMVKDNKVTYYLLCKYFLPVIFSELSEFIFKKCDDVVGINVQSRGVLFLDSDDNVLDILNKCKLRGRGELEALIIDFKKMGSKVSTRTHAIVGGKKYLIPICSPSVVLSVDFSTLKTFTTKSSVKYLNILKSVPLFKETSDNALMKVETFPYLEKDAYIDFKGYDFDKHSIIFGSSGSGKSKFISLLVKSICTDENIRDMYRFVVIDPHAEIKNDIGGLGKVIDFKGQKSSIDLFKNETSEIVSYTEEMLDIFKGELDNLYNPKLERVLRYSIMILAYSGEFNFANLRKLLVSIEYRTELISKVKNIVPYSVIGFFMGDFNEIKSTSYQSGIAPIISFLDEMEVLPAFNKNVSNDDIVSTIEDNFLTLFSLDNRVLGTKGVKTLAGIIMQSIFTNSQNRRFSKRLVLIVDEVSVIESGILKRFLAEARKYNVAVILAGQYFSQISEELRSAIFANVMNYYIFKVSRSDASLLVDNLNIRLEGREKDDAVSFLTDLKFRSLVARVSKGGVVYSPFLGHTMDLVSVPYVEENIEYEVQNSVIEKNADLEEFIVDDVDFKSIERMTSTRRKEWENE